MTRVNWIHECQNPGTCGYSTGGEIWVPNDDILDAHQGSTYDAASALGLTADPPPTPGRDYAMVRFDCRRAVLQMHYWDELEEQR